MRRKRSSSLPCFVTASGPSPSPVRRRHVLYAVLCIAFLLWCFRTPGSATDNVDWSQYAYSLYATDGTTLCHALLIFDALTRVGSKADRVLFYPKAMDTVVSHSADRDSQLLVMARDKYGVKLVPNTMLKVEGRVEDEWTGTWSKSVSKLLAFSLTDYKRVIALDSDITLLRSIDELFLLPPTPMALPRAYWWNVNPPPLTSMLMVLQPSTPEFERFRHFISQGGSSAAVANHKFDMELINDRYASSAMILPHRPYALLSGEFRTHNHSAYLGDPMEEWDAQKVYDEAKIVHFSDWPLPKPWVMWPAEGLAEVQPDCGGSRQGSCKERVLWKGLYEDFRARRKGVCRYLSVPAPDWRKIKAGLEAQGLLGPKANATEAGTAKTETGGEREAPVPEKKTDIELVDEHDIF